MQSPWLTIVTITKDDPVGLGRTLASARAWREFPGVEQVVVFAGDAIPDGIPEAVGVVRQASVGIARAFNEGLASARGEWIWFVNSGDAIHEELSPAWLSTLTRRTQADVVTGALLYDDEREPRPPPPPSCQWPMLHSWPAHPATLVRRRALVAIGGFDPRWSICMDFDLWHRLFDAQRAVDVVAMPFARFETNGISRRPEYVGCLYRENAAVVWRHKGRIMRNYWKNACEILRVFARAAKRGWK